MKPEWLNKWLLLAIIWFLASIYFLFLASGNNPLPIAHFDKICHFGLFFGQFWLLAKICLQSNITIPLRSYLNLFKHNYLDVMAIYWMLSLICLVHYVHYGWPEKFN